jgi:hypothetical protein
LVPEGSASKKKIKRKKGEKDWGVVKEMRENF